MVVGLKIIFQFMEKIKVISDEWKSLELPSLMSNQERINLVLPKIDVAFVQISKNLIIIISRNFLERTKFH